MLGTVGPPVPNVDARLESVPEMGYDALSATPRGEICIRGETLFSGYHKREDLTKEVLVDGWFHTGVIYFCMNFILGSLVQCIHIPMNAEPDNYLVQGILVNGNQMEL